MADIENDVVCRHPNGDDDDKNTRRVKQTTAKKHQNCKHQNLNQGQNHGENFSQQFKPRTIASKNGKKIKHHHHSFRFDDNDFKLFTKEQKKTLHHKRWAADQNSKNDDWKKEQERLKSHIVKSVMSQNDDAGSVTSEITQQPDANASPPGLPSSIMGDKTCRMNKTKVVTMNDWDLMLVFQWSIHQHNS